MLEKMDGDGGQFLIGGELTRSHGCEGRAKGHMVNISGGWLASPPILRLLVGGGVPSSQLVKKYSENARSTRLSKL